MLQEAKRVYLALHARHVADGRPEANAALNDAARAVVAATAVDYGHAWVGHVNPRQEVVGMLGSVVIGIVAWNREPVHNFGADFVLPAFDVELQSMIEARHRRRYTSAADDAVLVAQIYARVVEVGGCVLVWS
jgi:hypothetical protein